jgi:uncharacterized RDD family membrane protein YckC
VPCVRTQHKANKKVNQMGLVEGVGKGRTLGKLITGTKTVNLDETNIGFQTAFLRGLSGAVPFELFSIFGSGLFGMINVHTQVID